MPPSITLIIAVYNKPDVLRLVCTALARQTYRDAEVIFADDGSGPEVAQVIAEERARLPFAARHIRHDDMGWRKNTILNAAVRDARAQYLVFIDADCIPHQRFLEDHAQARTPGTVMCARRVEMSRHWSESLTPAKVASGAFEFLGPRVWLDSMLGNALRVEDGLRLPPSVARLLHGTHGRMLGSNFGVWKSDLEAINGFDEEYDGPGCGEDSDIEFRLGLAGVRPVALRHLAIQYHVWHPRTEVPERCIHRYERMRERGEIWCRRGLAPAGAHTEVAA